jgi:excisionase family DNA binding protein
MPLSPGLEGATVLGPDEVQDAARVARALRRVLAERLAEPVEIRLLIDERDVPDLRLPPAAARLLADLLVQLANGNAVTVVPIQAELTTQQAAELLGVSRPYLIGVLEAGDIRFRRVGNRRRVQVQDLLGYRARQDDRSAAAADELTRQAEEFGEYDE